MPGGKHAVNKAYTYKPRLSRAHKKRVVAAKSATSGGIVKRKTPAVIPSNIEKSNKKRANRGLARALEKLKDSGALNKAAKSAAGVAAGSAAGKKAAKDVDGDVEMKEAEHEIIVTKKTKAPKAPKKAAPAAVADEDSMDIDDEPAAKPAMRRSTRRSFKK